jgi:hypothetical protein
MMNFYLCNKKHYKDVRLNVYRDSKLIASLEQVPKLLSPIINKKKLFIFASFGTREEGWKNIAA